MKNDNGNSCDVLVTFLFFLKLHQAQNECQRERTERCKLERLQMHHKQVLVLPQTSVWVFCPHVCVVKCLVNVGRREVWM